jgi:hypothetical protein
LAVAAENVKRLLRIVLFSLGSPSPTPPKKGWYEKSSVILTALELVQMCEEHE